MRPGIIAYGIGNKMPDNKCKSKEIGIDNIIITNCIICNYESNASFVPLWPSCCYFIETCLDSLFLKIEKSL
jgi:hypothetical protein